MSCFSCSSSAASSAPCQAGLGLLNPRVLPGARTVRSRACSCLTLAHAARRGECLGRLASGSSAGNASGERQETSSG